MANSLKLLSWNIQKFGADKVADTNVIAFICGVIKTTGAQVVGLMELVGWQGNETRDALIKFLNNYELSHKTKIVWQGEASEMTPSRPNEQYVFLWQKTAVTAVGWQLWNVIGESVFDPYFKKNNIDANAQENFWKSLFNNGWTDSAFQVPWQKADALRLNYKSLDLTTKAPAFNLTDQQKKDIADVLTADQQVTFPVKGSRPPFLLHAKTVDTNTDVLFVLFHAPGPDSGLPIIASNQISFVKPARDTPVGVVMGDFNVDAKESRSPYVLQYFDSQSGRLQYVRDTSGAFIDAVPFRRLTGPAFATPATDPDLSKVENYEGRLASAKTSISTTLAGATVGADTNSVEAILSSEYDRFFVRAPKADASVAYAYNLIDAMVPKSVNIPGPKNTIVAQVRSTTTTAYQLPLAQLAAPAYNTWWDRQNSKKNKSKAAIKLLSDAPKIANNSVPSSLREAQYVYRYSLSDHLPIVMELQYA